VASFLVLNLFSSCLVCERKSVEKKYILSRGTSIEEMNSNFPVYLEGKLKFKEEFETDILKKDSYIRLEQITEVFLGSISDNKCKYEWHQDAPDISKDRLCDVKEINFQSIPKSIFLNATSAMIQHPKGTTLVNLQNVDFNKYIYSQPESSSFKDTNFTFLDTESDPFYTILYNQKECMTNPINSCLRYKVKVMTLKKDAVYSFTGKILHGELIPFDGRLQGNLGDIESLKNAFRINSFSSFSITISLIYFLMLYGIIFISFVFLENSFRNYIRALSFLNKINLPYEDISIEIRYIILFSILYYFALIFYPDYEDFITRTTCLFLIAGFFLAKEDSEINSIPVNETITNDNTTKPNENTHTK
jgi:hypothetical protein